MLKMESLECPFTWGFDDVKSHPTEYRSLDGEETLPLMQLMRKIVKLYIDSKNINSESDVDETMVMNEAEWDELSSSLRKSDVRETISGDVVDHIVQATRAFFFSKIDKTPEMERTLSSIKPIDTSNKIVKSSLLGCKSICWSVYARAEPDRAKNLLREAIRESPSCHLWHFVLGRILRNERRDFNYGSMPSTEEELSFFKAYTLCKKPVYGMFLGQVYREKRRMEEAMKIYDEVYEQQPESDMMLMRLALGFMAFKEMDKAKQCLDNVSKSPEKNSMFLHYQGIYHFKLKHYEIAARFFKDAAEDDNIGADYQYIECMIQIDKAFNVSRHLLEMVGKYQHFPEKQSQRILLDIAISYWKNDGNIEESLRYFLRALSIDPKSKIFTNCNPFQLGVKLQDKNVFRVIEREFLPLFQERQDSEEIFGMVKTLRQYCEEHRASHYRPAGNNFRSPRWR